jgi:ribonuclease HI
MPWVRASLKGQRVYVRALASGEPMAESGRVEVRYKPNDGRAYRAALGNLADFEPELLPDETCGDAEAPAEASKVASTSSAAPLRGAGRTASMTASKPIPEGAVVAYTDGACSGNPGPAGAGMRLQWGDKVIEGYTYLGSATNNVAELVAIREALVAVAETRALVVHTDSQYAIGVLQKGWKAKANQALIAEIRELLKGRAFVQLVYVRGHAGDPGNERADELARTAITQRATQTMNKVQ